MGQSQTIDTDFIEKLNKSGCGISTIAERQYLKWEVIFVNDDFQINSIKKI